MIKQLVDLGNPISSVAQLGDEQLRERLQQDNRSRRQLQGQLQHLRIAALGTTLVSYLEDARDRLRSVQLLGTFRHFTDFERSVATLAPDVIVIEYAGVHDETVEEVRELMRRAGTRRAVLVCGFGRRSVRCTR